MIDKLLYNIYVNENNEISICDEKGHKGTMLKFQLKREIERKNDPKDPTRYLLTPGNKTIGTIEFEILDEGTK